MMSFEELNNWDPMAEDYNNSQSNSYKNSNLGGDSGTREPCLFVRNVPSELGQVALERLFAKFGKVTRSFLKNQPHFPKTFGFVYFASLGDAENAFANMKNNALKIYVEFAKPKNDSAEKPNLNSSAVNSNVSTPSPVTDEEKPQHKVKGLIENDKEGVFKNLKVVKIGSHRSVYREASDHNEDAHEQGHHKSECNSRSSHSFVADSRHSPAKNELFQKHKAAVQEVPGLTRPVLLCSCCRNPAELVCTVCSEPYCSTQCQQKDWERHSSYCTDNDSIAPNHVEFRIPESPLSAVHENEKPPSRSGSSRSAESFKGNRTSDYESSDCENVVKAQKFPKTNDKNRCKKTGSLANDQRQNSQTKGHSLKTSDDSGFSSRESSKSSNCSKVENNIERNLVKESFSVTRVGGETRASESLNIKVPLKMRVRDLKVEAFADNEQVTVCHLVSPEDFWVQCLKNAEKLQKIENELKSLETRRLGHPPSVGDLCVSFFDDASLYRCSVVKLLDRPECLVSYVDYGNTSIRKISDLYCLTPELAAYPQMAVNCKLADVKPPGNEPIWHQADKEFFEHLTLNKQLKAVVVNKQPPKLEVDLLNNDGLSISSVLVNNENAEWVSKDVKQTSVRYYGEDSMIWEVPTVLSILEENKCITIIPECIEGGKLFSYIHVNDLQEFTHLHEELQKLTAGATLIAEEGDLAVALSSEDQCWYRCFVTKRSKNAINVRYIDTGHDDDVKKLNSLSEKHAKVRSCFVNLTFPKLNKDNMEKLSQEPFKAVVKFVCETNVVLTTEWKDKTVYGYGMPWFHGLVKETASHAESVPTNFCETPVQRKHSPNTSQTESVCSNVTSPCLMKASPTKKTTDFAERCLSERELSLQSRTKVRAIWLKSRDKLYVQREIDLPELETLEKEMNHLCNSLSSKQFVPVEHDVVCAKYSEDKKWYRSYVLKACDGKIFTVFFIDFGNTETVKLEDIRPLDEKFVSPKFTIRVALCDVPPHLSYIDIVNILGDKVFDLEVAHSKMLPMQVRLYFEGNNIFSASCNESKSSVPFAVVKKDILKVLPEEFNSSEVCVVHVNPSKHLYVQLLSRQSTLSELQKDMQAFFSKSSAKHSPNDSDVVGACLEGVWYRGYVDKSTTSNCLIMFFDFGYLKEVCIDNIKPLPEKFLQPVFSIPVVLDNAPENCLTDDAVKTLKSATLKLEFTDKTANPMKVKLFLAGLCLNKFLRENADAKGPAESATTEVRNKSKISFNSLKSQILVPDSTLEVVFTFEDCNKYYMQKYSDSKDIVKMYEIMQQRCKEAKLPVGEISANDVVCAVSSYDNLWHRGKIVQSEQEDKFTILFFDYGNSEVVERKNICALPEELLSYPIFSIYVHLYDRKQEDSINCNGEIIYYVQVCGTAENLSVKVLVQKSSSNTSDTLDSSVVTTTCLSDSKPLFIDTLKQQSLSVNQILDVIYVYKTAELFFLQNLEDLEVMSCMLTSVKKHCNESEPPDRSFSVGEIVCAMSAADMGWYRASICAVNSANDFEVCFIDFGNKEVVQKHSLRSFAHDLLSFPVFSVCAKVIDAEKLEQPLQCEVPFKVQVVGKNDSYVEVIVLSENNPSPDVYRVSNDPSVSNIVKSNLSAKCSTGPANTSSKSVLLREPKFRLDSLKQQTVSINEFLDVICVFKEERKFFLQKCNDLEIFLAVTEFLQKYGSEAKMSNQDFSVAELVCARSKVDCTWYRASICAVHNDIDFEVCFIDFGNKEVVHRYDIRLFHDELLSYPIFSISARVINAEMYEETINSGAPFMIQVVELGKDICVRIVPLSECDVNKTSAGKIVDNQTVSLSTSTGNPLQLVSSNKSKFSVDSLKQQSPSLNEIFDVTCVFQTDGKYFLQKSEDLGDLSVMSNFIQEYCDKAKSTTMKLEVNELVCARSASDLQWYRASICAVVNDTEFEVCFLDFGNNEVVHRDNIRLFHDSLFTYPVFSICTRIIDSEKLTDPVYGNFFKVQVEEVKTFKEISVRIVTSDKSSIHGQQSTCSPPVSQSTDKPQEQENLKPDDLPDEQGEGPPVLRNCKTVEFPEGKSLIIVYSIEDVESISAAPFIEENILACCQMNTKINSFYNESNSEKYCPVKVGEMVIAKFPDDGLWYRAIVVQNFESTYTIYFVDYGGVVDLTEESIRKIETRFLDLPIQSHVCKLVGFTFDESKLDIVNEEIKKVLPINEGLEAMAMKDEQGFICLQMPFVADHLVKEGLATLK